MWLAAWLAVLLALASGCEPRTAETPEREAGALVELAPVERGRVVERLATYGTVEFDPEKTREVTLVRSGEVRRVTVVAGQRVRKGDRLLVLGPVPAASAEAQRARIDLEFSIQELERVRRLAASQLATRSDLASAEQTVEANRVALRSLGLDGEQAEVPVVAEIDGIVAVVDAKEGSLMRTGDRAVLLAAAGAMAVRTGFEIEDLKRLGAGQAVEISPIFDDRGEPARAVLPALHGVADPQTQLVQTLLAIDSPPPWMIPGERVRLAVVLKREEDAIRVPREAILERGGGAGVFAIRDGIARWTPVEVTARGNRWRAVSGKISPGDLVATTGRSSLEEGMAVRTADAETAE